MLKGIYGPTDDTGIVLSQLLPETLVHVDRPDAPTLGQALENVADLHRGQWYHSRIYRAASAALARQAGGVDWDLLRGRPARDLVLRAIAAKTPA